MPGQTDLPKRAQSAPLSLRLPIDDTHTWHVVVEFNPGDGAPDQLADGPDVVYLETVEQTEATAEAAATAPDSRAVTLQERLLHEIERMQHGHDPVLSDPTHLIVET
jgi:hypothetical protein